MADLEVDVDGVSALSGRLRSASARLGDAPSLGAAGRGCLGAPVVETAVAASARVHDAMVRHVASEIDVLADGVVGTAGAVASADDRLAREAR